MFSLSMAMGVEAAKDLSWDTAIYVRISEEEKKKSITDSIENQKEILREYAAVHHLNVYRIYEDDGVRGGSFNRPAFKQMIKDIEAGHINCVLVKDLSRFGREHIDTDHYLERYFPQKGVRFISVIQGLDSVLDPHRMNSIEVPMLNIFNEQYLRQVSNSTKASLMMKRKEGKFVGSIVPYGYIRDKDDKHHLVIDEEVHTNVKDIFKWYLDYMSLSAIAKRLSDKGILSPKAHRMSRKGKTSKSSVWDHTIVKSILMQDIYTGDMVQGRTYSYNCKVNKREPLPRDKWDIVPGTHEAIIDKKTFDEVQSLLNRKSKPKKKDKKVEPSIFSGFLTCKECGKKMVRNTAYYTADNGTKTAYTRYICSTSKKYGSKVCGSHLINEDTLKDIIMDVIDTMISNIVDVSEAIKKAESGRLKKQVGILENQQYSAEKSIEKLSERIAGLYSDYKDEIITLAEYKDMKQKFTAEKEELEHKKSNILDNIKTLESNGATPCEAVEHYLNFRDITDINRYVLSQLVDEIYVDDERNITVNFKSRDEIRKYTELL